MVPLCRGFLSIHCSSFALYQISEPSDSSASDVSYEEDGSDLE
jgi:hypothetical protein